MTRKPFAPMRLPILLALPLLGLAPVRPAVAQSPGDPLYELGMELQRCVWSCLANSPGAESAAYNACVQDICSGLEAEYMALEEKTFGAQTAPAPAPEPSPGPATSPRPKMRPEAQAAAEPAPQTGTPALPSFMAPAPVTPGWSHGVTADRQGMFAGVTDEATGRRLDWLCRHGAQSLLALSPYAGDGQVILDVDGRQLAALLQVDGGAGYLPIGFADPVFAHMASGANVRVLDGGGLLGTFSMANAPGAIGQAEGRCMAGAPLPPG